MRIRAIEIRDFRKLGHVRIEGLADGLNVLVGDNEAGKSTLLAALRAGFFDRHRLTGDAADAMQPYGQTVRPEIAIEFELAGRPWRLHKAFCQRPEAELAGPGERLTGDAVEDRLAELLGFTPPGRGLSKPGEHQGAYGLLWVEQGGSHGGLGVGAGREGIVSAIEAEVGQVVGGERGRALLARAEERRSAYWDKREKPRGEYRELIDEVAGLEARRADLQARLASHEGRIAALAACDDALARHGRDQRLDRAAAAAAAARLAVQQAGALGADMAAAAERLDRTRIDLDAAAGREAARGRLVRLVAEAASAVVSSRSDAEEARQRLARLDRAALATDATLAAYRHRRREAGDRVRAVEQALARRQAADELGVFSGHLAAAEDAERRRQAVAVMADAIVIRPADVEALEALQGQADRARLQLDAASVAITFLPTGTAAIGMDGSPVDPSVPLLLSHDAVFDLEGFGRLAVHPGGGVPALRASAGEADRILSDRLRAIGMADLASARDALRQRLEALNEAASLARVVAGLAPRGLDELRQAVAIRKAALLRPVPDLADPTDAMREDARRMETLAQEAERAGEHGTAVAREAREAAGRDVATLAERSAAAVRDLEARREALAADRAQHPDDDLVMDVAAAARAAQDAERFLAQSRERLAAAEPDVAALELKRAEAAERAIRSDIETLTRDRLVLQTELATLGQDGLGEQLAEVEGRLAAAGRRLSARHVEAAAARLLHAMLATAQRETKERWLGPVRDRVRPYLKLIHPDSDIVLDETTLEIGHFVRQGVSEPFEKLSVGAREQVAVITRLAIAEILKASGRPSAVILDDALVNTDERRLDRMHLVLHKAAETLQILVLTCRERDFMQLGAPVHRI